MILIQFQLLFLLRLPDFFSVIWQMQVLFDGRQASENPTKISENDRSFRNDYFFTLFRVNFRLHKNERRNAVEQAKADTRNTLIFNRLE